MADEGKGEAPEKSTDLVAEIGEEGTIAAIQAKMNRVRVSDKGGLVEEPNAPPEGEEKPPAGEEPPEAKAGEEKPPEQAAEEKKVEAPALKYKSQEEAEAAQKEAERKMHEATTTAAKEREAREAAEKEAAELKAKLEETLAKPPEKPEEEVKPLTDADRKARVKAATKAALTTIRELDRSADDYDEQVEEAWAGALLEAGMGGTALSQAEIDKMVADSLKTAKKAQDEAEAKKATLEAGERNWRAALDQGKKAGLNLDDEDSADYMLFDAIERKLGQTGLPDELKGKPLSDVVDYMIKEVRRRTGKLVETTEAERELARKNQLKNAVLNKGLRTPPTAEEPSTANYSLAELQRADRERMKARQRGV